MFSVDQDQGRLRFSVARIRFVMDDMEQNGAATVTCVGRHATAQVTSPIRCSSWNAAHNSCQLLNFHSRQHST